MDYRNGNGDLILFLHGLGCSSRSFFKVFEADYFPRVSILIPDLPGFGDSAKPDDFSYALTDTAAVVEELVSELPFRRIHVIGHSMGGAVGLLFSDRFQARVATYASIEGNLVADDCGMFSRGIASRRFADYRDRGFAEDRARFPESRLLDWEHTTPQALYRSAQSLVQWSDSGKLLKKFLALPCAKAYLYGDRNEAMPVLKKLGEIPLFRIENSGHEVMMDNPAACFKALAAVIRGA